MIISPVYITCLFKHKDYDRTMVWMEQIGYRIENSKIIDGTTYMWIMLDYSVN